MIHARPTTYNGIQMRSRLEAAFAAHLDNQDEPWEYEPRCFANAQGQYLPDFLVRGNTYVEIKPLNADFDAALNRMHIILGSEPDAPLLVATRTDDGGFYSAGRCFLCPLCSTCECDRERVPCPTCWEELQRRRDIAIGDLFPPTPEPLGNGFQCDSCHKPATTGFLYAEPQDDIRLCDTHTAEIIKAGVPTKPRRRGLPEKGTTAAIRAHADADRQRKLAGCAWMVVKV